MNYKNKILSVLLPTIFLIISVFCPLFCAKTPSFLDLLFNFDAQNLAIILLLSGAILSLFIGSILLIKKNPYSIIFTIVSFVLFILTTSNSSNLDVGPGLVLLLFTSGLLTAVSYYSSIDKFEMSISDIAEMSLYIGSAILLDMFLKIRLMANGGSISIAMLPLYFLVIRKGFVKGFIGCGLIYGLVNCLVDGYGFIYYPLDYFMAFGSLAILGLFRPLIIDKERRLTIKGVIFLVFGLFISCSGRLFFATISGVKMWGMPTYWESLIYNGTYMLPSLVIVSILMVVLYKPLLLIEKKHPSL